MSEFVLYLSAAKSSFKITADIKINLRAAAAVFPFIVQYFTCGLWRVDWQFLCEVLVRSDQMKYPGSFIRNFFPHLVSE